MSCALSEHRRLFGLALAATMMGVVVGARTIVLIDGDAASSAPELIVGTTIFGLLLFTLVLESRRLQHRLKQRP